MKDTRISIPGASEVPILDLNALEIQPLTDHLLCEVVASGKSKGGILLTEGAEQAMLPRVRVIAAGPGRRDQNGNLIPMECQAGDVVLLAAPDAGAFHHVIPHANGKKRVLTSEQNVIGKVLG